jgi:hypothetical protein
MTNALPSPPPVLQGIEVNVVSTEEASLGIAEVWSGARLVGFTRVEDGALTLRVGSSSNAAAIGAHARTEVLAEAYRVLTLYPAAQPRGAR